MTILPKTLNNLRQELATKQTKEAAWAIIDEYFDCFDLDGINNELWLLTAGALTNDEMELSQQPIDRKNIIFFFEYTKMFFEAARLLCNIHQKEEP